MRLNSSEAFLAWLGFSKVLDTSKNTWLGHTVGAFLFFGFLLYVVALIGSLILFFFALTGTGIYERADPKAEAVRNLGLLVAAFLGAPFLIWRSIVAADQANTASEALFNDKLNAAAQGLVSRRQILRQAPSNTDQPLSDWEDDLVTRIVSLERLEGLVFERTDAAPRIARLIAGYIRGNFSCAGTVATEGIEQRAVPRIDLQKAIDALGRIYEIARTIDDSNWRLDLIRCNFDGVVFSNGYFFAADFSGSRFEGARLHNCNLEGAILSDCLLNFAEFYDANLRGANLNRIILNTPSSNFYASINRSDMYGVTLIEADVSAIPLFRDEQIRNVFATSDTTISNDLRTRMLPEYDHSRAHTLYWYVSEHENSAEENELLTRFEASGFLHWLPFDARDLAVGEYLRDFRKELQLDCWPYM